MHEDEYAALVRWGRALATGDGGLELAAAGRAILMLADEIERLQVELWNLRLEVQQEPQQAPKPEDDAAADTSTLLGQLTRRLRRVPRREGA